MASFVFLLYAFAHLGLLGWALWLFLRHRHPGTVPLLIVTFGLVYDNGVLAAGASLGHGEMLRNLSVPRYFMHAFGTPLLMLSALGLVRRSSGGWARSAWLAAGMSILTLTMIAVGFDADVARLELAPKAPDGVVSYGNGASHGPPIAPIVTIFVLIATGILLWSRGAGPWLLLGALVQFAAAAIGDAILIGGNLGELALLAGLVVSDARLSPAGFDQIRATAPPAARPGPSP